MAALGAGGGGVEGKVVESIEKVIDSECPRSACDFESLERTEDLLSGQLLAHGADHPGELFFWVGLATDGARSPLV